MERDAPGSVMLVCTPYHVCTLIKHIHSYIFTTSGAAQPCLQQAFLKCEFPAESVDKSWKYTVRIGQHLPLQNCARCTAKRPSRWEQGEKEKKRKNMSGKEDRELPAARTEHLMWRTTKSQPTSLSPSPPLQITRDTRLKEGRSNEGHISCYTEALPIQHYRNITS